MAARLLRLAALACAIMVLFVPAVATAYDDTGGLAAHSMINHLSFETFVKSVMPSDPSLKNCSLDRDSMWSGVGIEVNTEGNSRGDWPEDINDGKGMSMTVRLWLSYGGFTSDEPEYPSALTHFYDPSNKNEPWLTDQQVGVVFFRQASRLSPGTFIFGDKEIVNPHISAKELALHGTMKTASSQYFQKMYSWDSAKLYYRAGLESTDKNNPNYGKAWRSLGEVMHLMADMCLPAHVRNDGHAAALKEVDPMESTTSWEDIISNAGNPYSGSISYYVSSGGKQVANDPAVLFDQVASWTHDNFFSRDTIDSSAIKSMRVVGNYSIRTVDGKDALAARVTKVYWDAESPPKTFYSIDGAVADDQRKFLIPTAIKSGATLIDSFLPRFTVEVEPQPVDADKPDGDYDVKVSLTHVPTPEWQGELTVKNGAYLVVNDEKTEVTLSGNDFNEYTLRMKLKPGDKVYAEYNLGGYIVRSDTVTVTDKPYVRTLKTWTTYDSGGRKTSEYTYYNDTSGKRVYHGTYRVFSSDGTITESTYVENVLNGPEKQYNKNGLLWAEGQNTNGKRTGTWKDYHFTGELARVKQYNANGELDGLSYGYFQDGKVSDEITYSNDKIVQIVRYERDGHVYEVQSYSNGVLVKRTYYNPDGSVSSVTNY